MSNFTISDEDFRFLRDVIRERFGIYYDDAKQFLLLSRLQTRLVKRSFTNYADYVRFLRVGADREAEFRDLASVLSNNETYFFRERAQLKALCGNILTQLQSASPRLRIWSAACSSGQEPYSAALTILSQWPEAAASDVRVLATDIDPHILAAGAKGVYSEALIENVPVDQRKRFFEPVTIDGKPHWRVGAALRELVTFRQLNLIEPWPMKGTFDAIFCRNVVIYFDEGTQQRLWTNFVPRLGPQGALYIGHSERVTGPATQALVSDGVSTYRHKGAASR